MTETASLADVRLVLAISESGSIGAAAGRLHMTQPSASQRLAVLERRIGVALVDRDTTGARLTPAGELFVAHGQRALDLVDEAVASARSPQGLRLHVGTIGSLAPAVFPALQRELPDHAIAHATAHGFQLAQAVADGALDAAVVGVGVAEAPATGVSRTALGRDPIILVGVATEPGSSRRPLAGHTVVVATYAHDYPVVAAKVARLGAEAHDSASTATAVALARQEGWLAAVPRTTAASLDLLDQEVTGVRLGLDVPIWLVTRGPRSAVLVDRADRLGDRMGLR
jgi:DNA-binding transcriptional LysR family regulator